MASILYRSIRILNLLFFTFHLTGCYTDGPPEAVQPMVHAGSGSSGVFVTNEGNFQFGNASVSYLDLGTGAVSEDLYKESNGKALGDVCQSMTIFNGKAYLVINNSGKVEVCNSITLKREGTISGLSSPRYFLPVSNNKAYITDLYAKAVSVADLPGNAVLKKINFPGETGPLLLLYGMAFVTSAGGNYLYMVNTASDKLQDSILIGSGANSIRQDCNGKIWVACGSDAKAKKPGAFYRIDPLSRKVELTLNFPDPDDSPWRLCSNGGNDTLYYLNKGVFRIPVTAAAVPAVSFIPEAGRNFYGLGIDPHSGLVYVADALDYVQRGRIYRYAPDGKELDYFLAGNIPGDFCFQ